MKNINSNKGFTLIELMIVMVIIGIIAGIAVLGYLGVIGGVKDKLSQTRLSALAEAQSRYRIGLGRGRYASLKEIAAARSNTGEPLVPDTILKFDRNHPDEPVVANGWILGEDIENQRTQFRMYLSKDELTALCIHEDGVLRKGRGSKPSSCDRSSEPVE